MKDESNSYLIYHLSNFILALSVSSVPPWLELLPPVTPPRLRRLAAQKRFAILAELAAGGVVIGKRRLQVLDVLLAAYRLPVLRDHVSVHVVRHEGDLLHPAGAEELHVGGEEQILRFHAADGFARVLHFAADRACPGGRRAFHLRLDHGDVHQLQNLAHLVVVLALRRTVVAVLEAEGDRRLAAA